MTRRNLFFIALFLWLVAPSGSAQADCVPAQGAPLTIGAVFPPESLFSPSANDAYHGFQAMIGAWNTCSGGRPVQVIEAFAADREETLTALEQLQGKVSLIVGSGSSAVSEVLVEASQNGDFILWEVTEPLDNPHAFAFSPRPNSTQLAHHAAAFITDEIPAVLDGDALRIALIYEDQPRARTIAEAAKRELNPHIYQVHDTRSSYRTAVQMREQDVNVMLFITLDPSTDQLRYNLLQADANLKAWVQVSSAPYEPDICEVLTITTAGRVNEAHRVASLGAFYTQYKRIYNETYGKDPSPRSDLTASGTYLLLQIIASAKPASATPANEQDTLAEDTVSAIQAVIMGTTPENAGLWGEHWQYEAASGTNAAAITLTQQLQPEGLCTLHPDGLATCTNALMTFPTWREQAKNSFTCR